MAFFRLINGQQTNGQEIMVTELNHGLPRKPHERLRKQPMYIPYNHKFFANNGVTTDTNFAGFKDFVPTDEFVQSEANGQISGLKSSSHLSSTSYAEGDLQAPSISNIKHDTSTTEEYAIAVTIDDDGSNTGDWDITITNANISDTKVTYTDSSSTSSSKTIADGLASAIDGNSTLSSEVSTSTSGNASSATLTLETKKEATPFSVVSLSSADTPDTFSQSTVATGRVIIEGSRLTSVNPFESEFTLIDTGNNSKTFTATEVSNASSGLVSQSTVVVPNGLHGMGSSTGDVDEVSVQTQDPNDNKTASNASMSQV